MRKNVLRGTIVVVVIALVAAIMLFIPRSRANKSHPPNDDPWKLVSYDPNNPYGTYLSNGFISTRIMGDGVGSQDGRPLPCFMAGLYDDEKLVQCPTWSDLRFYDGKTQFKIDKDADYKQTLDMKAGILTTEATWRAGSKTLKGKIEVIVSRAEPHLGLVKATLTPDFDGKIGLSYPVSFGQNGQLVSQGMTRDGWASDYSCSTKHSGTSVKLSRWADIEPGNLRGGLAIAGRVKSGSDKQEAPVDEEVKLKSGARVTVTAYADVAVTSAKALAAGDVRQLQAPNADAIIAAHKSAWAKLWQKDIVTDGSKADQQAIHSCMFYLLQSVRAGSQWSLPPMGLSNNAFSGHVFWDADLWMFPALILQHPELARAIVDYRYNTLAGAMANAKAEGFSGAQYAWESGGTGREDTPPGLLYRQERHIDGDIAIAQWQYYLATGDMNWLRTRGYPVLKATADYWVSRAKFVPAKKHYEILKVVPPDENADLVDNSAYTNCIAKMNLEIAARCAKEAGLPANPKWSEVAAKMYIPFDAGKRRFIAFDNYKGLKAKQADCELLVYPLQFKTAGENMTEIYKNTFSFYAPKVMANGPAMTSSVHSVISARLGDSERAYKCFVESYKPFLRGPFDYFNEKQSRTYDNMCFLTGAAGPIQAALFGLAGARIDYFPTGASTPPLTFEPRLPKALEEPEDHRGSVARENLDVAVNAGNRVTVTPR